MVDGKNVGKAAKFFYNALEVVKRTNCNDPIGSI